MFTNGQDSLHRCQCSTSLSVHHVAVLKYLSFKICSVIENLFLFLFYFILGHCIELFKLCA